MYFIMAAKIIMLCILQIANYHKDEKLASSIKTAAAQTFALIEKRNYLCVLQRPVAEGVAWNFGTNTRQMIAKGL